MYQYIYYHITLPASMIITADSAKDANKIIKEFGGQSEWTLFERNKNQQICLICLLNFEGVEMNRSKIDYTDIIGCAGMPNEKHCALKNICKRYLWYMQLNVERQESLKKHFKPRYDDIGSKCGDYLE